MNDGNLFEISTEQSTIIVGHIYLIIFEENINWRVIGIQFLCYITKWQATTIVGHNLILFKLR